MSKKRSEGWGFPAQSKKAHYFVGGISLCRKWAFSGNLEAAGEQSPDDCAACALALAKRKEANTVK